MKREQIILRLTRLWTPILVRQVPPAREAKARRGPAPFPTELNLSGD